MKQTGITDAIGKHEIGSCSIYFLPTASEGVVSVAGSFSAPERLGLSDDILRDLTVGLLDKGTINRDRFEISESLDRAGVEREYSLADDRIRFRGRAISSNSDVLVDTLFEELLHPLLDPEQLATLQNRYDYAILRSTESTGSMANGLLSRMIYEPGHPNYEYLPAVRRQGYAAVTVDDIRDYHSILDIRNDLTVVVVGAFDQAKLLKAFARNYAEVGNASVDHRDEPIPDKADSAVSERIQIHSMRDKNNLDVALGFRLNLRRTDADYLPLFVGNFALGGNFSSRLMQIVRDEMGLTYGIRSQLSGVSPTHAGNWQVGVTLSSDSLVRGIAATRDVVADFFTGRITDEEVEKKKRTIRGSYSTRVSTTGALAASILKGIELGYGPHYPDIYRDEISAVTATQVNDVIARHLLERPISTAIAGTIDASSVAALRPAK